MAARKKKKPMDEKEATFVVRLTKKGAQPWKGHVVWISGRNEQNFNSMQELFELMGTALENDGPKGAGKDESNAG